MIKGTKGLMLLSVSFFLSGCGFNEEEAVEESTNQLESFFDATRRARTFFGLG